MSIPVKVTILGRSYPLKIDESEIEHIRDVSDYVDSIMTKLRDHLRQQPESTAMALGALQIAEELFQAKRRIEELERGEVQAQRPIDEQQADHGMAASVDEPSTDGPASAAPVNSDDVVAQLNRKLENLIDRLQEQV
jgi:cell division protein ZapA